MRKGNPTQITYGNYRIEHDTVATSRFNLYKTKPTVVSKATAKLHGKTEGDVGIRELTMGYGMTLEQALVDVLYDVMNDKGEDLTLNGYLEEFRSEKSKLLTALGVFGIEVK
jgi:hypothetical protein